VKLALLLIALGYGFKLYVEANSITKKKLKKLGRWIAGFIMVIAFLGSLCSLVAIAKYSKGCYTEEKGYFCPLSGKGSGSTTGQES
jgi:hypothetical protein